MHNEKTPFWIFIKAATSILLKAHPSWKMLTKFVLNRSEIHRVRANYILSDLQLLWWVNIFLKSKLNQRTFNFFVIKIGRKMDFIETQVVFIHHEIVVLFLRKSISSHQWSTRCSEPNLRLVALPKNNNKFTELLASYKVYDVWRFEQINLMKAHNLMVCFSNRVVSFLLHKISTNFVS